MTEKIINPEAGFWSDGEWNTQKDGEGWEHSTGIKTKTLLEEFLNDLPRDISILDVGCGDGYMIDILHEMGFHNVDGMDVNHQSLERVRKKYPDRKFFEMDICDVTKPLRYTLVIHSGLLIHIHPVRLEHVIMNLWTLSTKYVFGKEVSTPRPTPLGDMAVDTRWRNRLWTRRFIREWTRIFPKMIVMKHRIITSRIKDASETEVFLCMK